MNSGKLKDIIKKVVNRVYPDMQPPPLEYSEEKKIYIIPELRDIVIKLFTSQYNIFLRNIEWVSPNPTTFRLVLSNNNYFYLYWMGYYWKAEILGKNFYLNDNSSVLNASEYILDLLKSSSIQSDNNTESNVDNMLNGDSDNDIKSNAIKPDDTNELDNIEI